MAHRTGQCGGGTSSAEYGSRPVLLPLANRRPWSSADGPKSGRLALPVNEYGMHFSSA